ncbi:hypothetical protein DXG03_002581 [Asterophora parasitica]|uniref:Mitochondrial carrier protein n=1 Tax=Asterophora parasitica TaxID=117018 RepID=A0A9P7G5K8_9AGAR|nr:hypothetical protein DXG03_002581 [Asterophora parasitica]
MDTSNMINVSDNTPSTSPVSTTPAPPTTGLKIRVPVRIRPYFHPHENITFDFDEEEPQYDEITARQDESAYSVLPTGRIVAGSKRAAKARESHPVLGAGGKPGRAEAEMTMMDVSFGGGTAVEFEGFGAADCLGLAMTSGDVKPTFVQSLVAGGAAGTASAQGFARAGGLSGIYKGIGSVVVGSAPGAAVFFSTYETMKKHSPLQDYAPVNHMLSASVAEVAACLIRVPTEVIKTRTQTMTYGALGKSSLAAAKQVLANDGWSGFYRGFRSTIMREIPFTSLQFPLYELLKTQLSRKLQRKPLYAHEAAICGSIAGGTAAALTTPLDVLKTRVMLDLRNPSKEKLPSLRSRLVSIYVNEGARALFAGVVPRTLWISAGGAVFLGVYEWVVHGLIVLPA